MTVVTPTDSAGTGTDTPGWYCYSARPRLAEWDGVAWTGTAHAALAGPVLAGPPGPFAFVRQPWLRWMALGQALVILPAVVSGTSGHAWWSWISVIGYLAVLAGGVMVVSRFLDLDRIERRRTLTWIGIGSGVVAFGLGVGLEVLVEHLAGWSTTLWMTGPIEEGGKLLVPFVLLMVGAPKFRLPRVGFYLVLVSGATVGVLEGVEYQARPGFAWAHLQMALIRPSAELLHVFVAGFAAAVIWLAAWRRGRAVTGAGLVAFLMAAGIHSFHDGIITFFHVRPQSFQASLARTLQEAIGRGLAGMAVALVLAAFLYLLARHGARELTAPAQVAGCPPYWRPQIKTWGCDPTPPPVVDVASVPWDETAPAPPGFGQSVGYGQPVGYGGNIPGAAPGWYPIAGEPGHQGWWTGSTWTRIHRWDGSRWWPG